MKKVLININILAIICLISLSIIPFGALAQSFTSFEDLGLEEQISVKMTPEIPGPHENVDVYVTSYMFDMDKSVISWYLNETLLKKDLGLRSASFKTGAIGEKSVVRLSIQKSTGSTIEKTFTVTPAEVDIVVEPITYTPPFYKGRSVATFESPIKLIAVPNFVDINGRAVPDSEMVYTWKVNGKVVQGKSGARKNTYIHETDIISRPVEVTLTASPVNSEQTAKITRVIDFIQPQILIYEDNPIFGTIFERAVNGDFVLNRQEIVFEAVPMFFDLEAMRGQYVWNVNGKEIIGLSDREITFRREDSNPGIASVSISIRDTEKILQAARASFSLTYNEGKDFQF